MIKVVVNNKVTTIQKSWQKGQEWFAQDIFDEVFDLYECKTETNILNRVKTLLSFTDVYTPEFVPNHTSLGIFDIKCEIRENDVYLFFELERPAFLIGKGGRVIDWLRNELKDWLGVKVEIDIKESNFWYLQHGFEELKKLNIKSRI